MKEKEKKEVGALRVIRFISVVNVSDAVIGRPRSHNDSCYWPEAPMTSRVLEGPDQSKEGPKHCTTTRRKAVWAKHVLHLN